MTLYQKIGRRYHPVSDTEALDGIPNGVWVVTVADGIKKATRALDGISTLEEIAALHALEDSIAKSLQLWTTPRPPRPQTARERKAWEAYCAVMGPDARLTLTRDSATGVARNIIQDLCRIIKENKTS